MGTNYGQHFNTKVTPQSEPIPGTNQVPNSAGGYSWKVDNWKQLDRFLILGSEGGTYYIGERKLSIDNANAVLSCVKEDGIRAVNRIVEISDAGRAPKNDPALFALAIAASLGNATTKKAALDALSKVARIGTHLFHFMEYVNGMRGWGRGLRRAIGEWYTGKTSDDLAYQAVKYQSRNGWSHRDALRLSHPHAPTNAHDALFHWIVKGEAKYEAPTLVQVFEAVQQADEAAIVRLINANPKLPWEAIPSEHLKSARVWEALLPNLPLTATLRNLARMTANGLLAPMSDAAKVVTDRVTNEENLKKARVHPIAVLAALKTYAQGHGEKGKLTWTPVTKITDALNSAFYKTFQNVEPTGKNILLALDVSGSMECGNVSGVPGLTPRVASAALALVTASVEPNCHIMGFSHELVDIDISPKMRLDDVIKKIGRIPMGRTDCSLPMCWAEKNKANVDLFSVYTDSETWCGGIHPKQALDSYRRAKNQRAKLVVVAMVANEFTIADPNDAGMLDVVGFDTATPALISDFAVS